VMQQCIPIESPNAKLIFKWNVPLCECGSRRVSFSLFSHEDGQIRRTECNATPLRRVVDLEIELPAFDNNKR